MKKIAIHTLILSCCLVETPFIYAEARQVADLSTATTIARDIKRTKSTLDTASDNNVLYPSGSIVRLGIMRDVIRYDSLAPHNTPINQAITAYANITGVGGDGDGYAAPYYFSVPGDNLDYKGNNYVDAMHIDHNFGGAGTIGSRAGLSVDLRQTGPTGNARNSGYYVGADIVVGCAYNDSGSIGFANAAGQCIAFNPIVSLTRGATYYYTLDTAEFDTEVDVGASVAQKYGYLGILSGQDAIRGTYDDAAIAFSEGSTTSPGWRMLIQNGKSDGRAATSSDSTIIGCGATSVCPAMYGDDYLTKWKWSINGIPFRSPSFSVDAVGNITSASQTTGALTARSAVLGTVRTTGIGIRLSSTDCGGLVRYTGGLNGSVTISAGLPIGCKISILQVGPAAVVVKSDGSETLETTNGVVTTSGQYSGLRIIVDTVKTSLVIAGL